MAAWLGYHRCAPPAWSCNFSAWPLLGSALKRHVLDRAECRRYVVEGSNMHYVPVVQVEIPNSAPQSRVAFASMASKTRCRSPTELEINCTPPRSPPAAPAPRQGALALPRVRACAFRAPFPTRRAICGWVQRALSFRSGRTKAASNLVGTVTSPLAVSGPSQGSSVSILTEPHDNPRLFTRSPHRREREAWRRVSTQVLFAVFELITSSYLVGACTGNSDGFSPLRMRST